MVVFFDNVIVLKERNSVLVVVDFYQYYEVVIYGDVSLLIDFKDFRFFFNHHIYR